MFELLNRFLRYFASPRDRLPVLCRVLRIRRMGLGEQRVGETWHMPVLFATFGVHPVDRSDGEFCFPNAKPHSFFGRLGLGAV